MPEVMVDRYYCVCGDRLPMNGFCHGCKVPAEREQLYHNYYRERSPRSRSLNGRKVPERTYRGSSGSRLYRRTYERNIRLQDYYNHQSKKLVHRHERSDRRRSSHERSDRRRLTNERSDRRRSSHERSDRRKSKNSNNRGDHKRKSSSRGSYNKRDGSEKGEERASSERVKNDEDGHLIYKEGDRLKNRYEVLGLLGEGTFGKCLHCYDRDSNRIVALKVIRNIKKYREAAQLEVKVLKKIAKKDPEKECLCIELLGSFDYHGHACLVFPKLGKSIFDFMKENNYQPYPLLQVQHIAYQLLKAVKFLHDNKLTHTDLKPENMLFMDSSYTSYWSESSRQEIHDLRNSEIRLIDFGSATFDYEHHSTVVSTRHYRALEVVLELGWSHPCDVWSCACIIYELYCGNTLFQTHDNREHLAMMERTLGKIPSHMIKETKKTKYFRHDALDWDSRSSEGKYVKGHCKPLKRHMKDDDELSYQLFDLLEEMFVYEPDKRITAKNALQHPFFSRSRPDAD